MDDTTKQAPSLKPHAMPFLPTELWLTIFEHFAALNTHIFEQSYEERREATRNLQRLQFVCKAWRVRYIRQLSLELFPDTQQAIIKPLTCRNPTLGCDRDEALDKIVKFASLLDEAEGSGFPGALNLDTFWIEKMYQSAFV